MHRSRCSSASTVTPHHRTAPPPSPGSAAELVVSSPPMAASSGHLSPLPVISMARSSHRHLVRRIHKTHYKIHITNGRQSLVFRPKQRYRLHITRYRSPPKPCIPPITRYRLQITRYRSPPKDYEIHHYNHTRPLFTDIILRSLHGITHYNS